MSSYTPPITANGNLKSLYNPIDFSETTLTKTHLNNNYVKQTGGSIVGSLSLSGSLGLSNSGITNITGVIAGTNYADTILTPTYSASMSFNFQNGQCYFITTTGGITGVTITNLPTTPLKTYVFTFILNTTSQTNLITATNITINSTSVPVYYSTASTSATNLFVQTLYILNISSTSTPSWKILSSYSNY